MQALSTFLIGIALVSGLSWSSPATIADSPSAPHACVRAAVDDPPPVDCPFCGGNIEEHRRRVAYLQGYGARTFFEGWLCIW